MLNFKLYTSFLVLTQHFPDRRYNVTSGEYDRDATTAAQNNKDKNKESKGPDVWSRHGEHMWLASFQRGWQISESVRLIAFVNEASLFENAR